MLASHEIILIAGVLFLCAIFAGIAFARIGAPLLLVFMAVGMLAGEDGPGGIPFDDFQVSYLVGSIALAGILFQGGLGTHREMIRQALWPATALATVGVAISAGLVGIAVFFLFNVSWPEALLLGAVTAPTDAAAVTVLLRLSNATVPAKVVAALEVESGLNDPMSVFLVVALVEMLTLPGGTDLAHAVLLFAKEMGGGAAFGLAGGFTLVLLFRKLVIEASVYPVLAVGGALAVFGAAQVAGVSGFLAVYLAGVIVGNAKNPATMPVTRFFDALGWLAQIVLFLLLGLLVTPHGLPRLMLPALAVTAVLILVARPASVMACLLPFRWPWREAAFVSWVGLRGAVPIYLTIIPLLAGIHNARILFDITFVVTIVSVAIQGWTIAAAARALRLRADRRPTTD